MSWSLLVTGALGAVTLAASPPPTAAQGSCLRLTKAGTQIQGEVKVCPGRYRLSDPTERGVIIVAASGSRLDLTGVTLESGDSLASGFVGTGVASRGVDSVRITGGTIRGYRYGLRLEGGRGHIVTGVNLSGSRKQALRSTATAFDEADWLDIFRPDTFELYGGGLLLKWTDGAIVTGVTARGGQNGIGLIGARGTYLADNDVSDNTGWGIHLWASSHNVIVRNRASRNVRCESPSYSRGCDSAALLLRHESDSNLVADNDLTHSGDGFFLSGHRPLVKPSAGNLVLRNDGSFAYHNAFESTFSWGNHFIENRADSSRYGFWLGYSSGTVVRGNTVIGSRIAGIAIEHGSSNTLAGNVVIGGQVGIQLFAPQESDEPSRGYAVDDNVLADLERGLVLQRTSQVRIRGNLFDGVGEGLVVDEAGEDAMVHGNVFLRARRFYIAAVALNAGGNYWGTGSVEETAGRIKGRVTLTPWRPAADAGY